MQNVVGTDKLNQVGIGSPDTASGVVQAFEYGHF